MMQFYTKDGRAVRLGQVIRDFRGEEWVFVRVSQEPTARSTGKIEVRKPDRAGSRREFFPSVFEGYIK